MGFRAGAHLTEVSGRVTRLGGARLKCDRAKSDRRLSECRAVVSDSAAGTPLHVWLSAVDSVSAVTTVSGDVSSEQLAEWRAELERRYGTTGAKVQGSQWMMQWIRAGRMVRLTWRVRATSKIASVSLIDGWILDGWGKTVERLPAVLSPPSDSTASAP